MITFMAEWFCGVSIVLTVMALLSTMITFKIELKGIIGILILIVLPYAVGATIFRIFGL